jgi:hypothetical protein
VEQLEIFARSLFKSIDAFEQSLDAGCSILCSRGLSHVENLLMEVSIKELCLDVR